MSGSWPSYQHAEGWAEVVVIAVLAGLYLLYFIPGVSKSNQPPRVPSYVPGLGHTLQLKFRSRKFLKQCTEKYGNVFEVSYFGKQVYVASGELAVEVMKMNDLDPSEGLNAMFLLVDVLDPWHGALGSSEKLLSHRKLVLENLEPLSKRIFPDLVHGIQAEVRKELGAGESKRISLKGFLSKVVVHNVVGLIVGKSLADDPTIRRVIARYFKQVEGKLANSLPWGLFPIFGPKISQFLVRSTTPSIKAFAEIKQTIRPTVEVRQSLSTPPTPQSCFLDILVDSGYSLDIIAHTIMVLMFTITATTTSTSLRVLNDLLAHPQFLPRLQQEQEEIFSPRAPLPGEDASMGLDREKLQSMIFLNSAIRETMRHRAYDLDQCRFLSAERTLSNGMVLPAQSIVAIDKTSLHFNPLTYGASGLDSNGEDPYLYRPFRFVGTRTNATRVTHSFAGFGAGKHACPGRFFAVQQVTLILSNILRTYDLATADGKLAPFCTDGLHHPDIDVVISRRSSPGS